MSWLISYLNHLPLAGLLVVVAVGWLVGKLEWRGATLTPAGGALVVGLLLGHLGMAFAPIGDSNGPRITVGAFGFALFIYAVGFDSGGQFFGAFRRNGLRFLAVGIVVNVLAVATILTAAHLLSLDDANATGILAGSLTSTPALVAATQVVSDPGKLTVSYAVTYPIGQLGLLLLITLVPRVLRDEMAGSSDGSDDAEDDAPVRRSEDVARSHRVARPDVLGKSLRELDLRRRTGCVITRVHRGAQVFVPDAETTLVEGDQVWVHGRLADHERFDDLVGPEIYDAELRERLPTPRRVLVVASDAVGKTLEQLQLIRRFHCLVTRIERAGESVPPSGELELQRDDIVEVVGRKKDIQRTADALGHLEPATWETNIAIYALGIVAGLVLGNVSLPVGGIDLSLGAAGGLLLTGVLLGRFRRLGRFSAHVPRPARLLVRELGILLFISEAGVRGGADLVSGLSQGIGATLLAGALTLTVPVVLTYVFARKVLGLATLDAWGSLCGGMTSSTALAAVNRAADSNEATTGYAASYAVATVLVTAAGQIVALATRGP